MGQLLANERIEVTHALSFTRDEPGADHAINQLG